MKKEHAKNINEKNVYVVFECYFYDNDEIISEIFKNEKSAKKYLKDAGCKWDDGERVWKNFSGKYYARVKQYELK